MHFFLFKNDFPIKNVVIFASKTHLTTYTLTQIDIFYSVCPHSNEDFVLKLYVKGTVTQGHPRRYTQVKVHRCGTHWVSANMYSVHVWLWPSGLELLPIPASFPGSPRPWSSSKSEYLFDITSLLCRPQTRFSSFPCGAARWIHAPTLNPNVYIRDLSVTCDWHHIDSLYNKMKES